jgi:hypothetical protein
MAELEYDTADKVQPLILIETIRLRRFLWADADQIRNRFRVSVVYQNEALDARLLQRIVLGHAECRYRRKQLEADAILPKCIGNKGPVMASDRGRRHDRSHVLVAQPADVEWSLLIPSLFGVARDNPLAF